MVRVPHRVVAFLLLATTAFPTAPCTFWTTATARSLFVSPRRTWDVPPMEVVPGRCVIGTRRWRSLLGVSRSAMMGRSSLWACVRCRYGWRG
jgi:hypothetical protein